MGFKVIQWALGTTSRLSLDALRQCGELEVVAIRVSVDDLVEWLIRITFLFARRDGAQPDAMKRLLGQFLVPSIAAPTTASSYA